MWPCGYGPYDKAEWLQLSIRSELPELGGLIICRSTGRSGGALGACSQARSESLRLCRSDGRVAMTHRHTADAGNQRHCQDEPAIRLVRPGSVKPGPARRGEGAVDGETRIRILQCRKGTTPACVNVGPAAAAAARLAAATLTKSAPTAARLSRRQRPRARLCLSPRRNHES